MNNGVTITGWEYEDLPRLWDCETKLFIKYGEYAKAAWGNIGLVAHIVLDKFRYRPYDVDDLFQEGCVGLMKAVRKFDLTYDVRFSSYAVPCIIGEIRRYIRDNSIIRLSRTLHNVIKEIDTFIDDYHNTHGTTPGIYEIASGVGVSTDVVREYYTTAQVSRLETRIGSPVSDGSNSKNRDTLLSILVTPDTEEDFDEALINTSIMNALDNGEINNTERAKEILRLRRLGLTQQEIGEHIGVSQGQISRDMKEIKDALADIVTR